MGAGCPSATGHFEAGAVAGPFGPSEVPWCDQSGILLHFVARNRAEEDLWWDHKEYGNTLLRCLQEAVRLHKEEGSRFHGVGLLPPPLILSMLS